MFRQIISKLSCPLYIQTVKFLFHFRTICNPQMARCLYKYIAEKDRDKNKIMKINERWEYLKEEANANIQSEKGILNRLIRSVQTEGHFGDIKENEDKTLILSRKFVLVIGKSEITMEKPKRTIRILFPFDFNSTHNVSFFIH